MNLINKWVKKDHLDLGTGKLLGFRLPVLEISTVHLELSRFGYWYETMIFIRHKLFSRKLKCYYQKRYKTEEEAKKGHENVINLIKERKFNIANNEIIISLA